VVTEARAYQCPVCGAFAQDGDRTCRHCSTLLATLRCGKCFGLNFPDDLHCRGCGSELGLTPATESDAGGSCPDCKLPLVAFDAGADGGTLHVCERCGGQMVSHGLLRALIEQRETLGRAVPLPVALPRSNPLSAPVRYRPCPDCQQLMHRKNFGGTSGIIVDVCSLHGTFFDNGELPRVLAFVRRGGLAKAQASLQQERAAAPLSASFGLATPPATNLLDDVGDLLAFVLEVLRGK
jgi:Zn-finger nucleic acid-binding protein